VGTVAKLVFTGGEFVLAEGFEGNRVLANLHVATARRFAEGRGSYLTLPRDQDGMRVTTSYWLSPGSPLSFVYDAFGRDTDAVIPPVAVDDREVIDTINRMDAPLGIFFVPESEEPHLPFQEF
jgi:hypothetical protein